MAGFFTPRTFLLFIGFALVLSGCGRDDGRWQPGKPFAREKLIIAVIYISDAVNEKSGYTYEHERGIQEMAERMGLKPEQVIRKINVIDTDQPTIENAIRDSIAQGANIVIGTSYGYMDTCEKMAEEFPNIVFAHATGYKRNDRNFTNYFGRVYQARYLSGIAAGLKTKTGKIGYVAAMGKENSEVTGGINAFALGVESVNPEARILFRVTYSWFDPLGESAAARRLIELGCDVLAQHCDTPNPQIEAEKAGVWSIGYNSDMFKDAPGAVITSVVWNWGVYYTRLVQSVVDGSFTTAPWLEGIAVGVVDITPVSVHAAPATAEAIAAARERIDAGGFNVFDGELETNDGRTVGEAGNTLSDSVITGDIHWYYRTVIED